MPVPGFQSHKALFISVLVALVLILSVGDSHTCVQSGPCVACLHASVSILPSGLSNDIPFVDFGASTPLAVPKLAALLVLPRTLLRAPPALA
jgi:hypothetical protein